MTLLIHNISHTQNTIYIVQHMHTQHMSQCVTPAKRTTGGRDSGVMDTLGDVSMYVIRNLLGVPE